MDNPKQPTYITVEINLLLKKHYELLSLVNESYNEKVYKIKEACERMNVSNTMIYSLMNKGLLKYYAVEGGRRVSEMQIRKYFKSVDSGQI